MTEEHGSKYNEQNSNTREHTMQSLCIHQAFILHTSHLLDQCSENSEHMKQQLWLSGYIYEHAVSG